MQQKSLCLRRLPVEHFFGQVVEHVTLAAGECLDKTFRIFVAPQREGSQLEARDPSFGALFQGCHVFLCQHQGHRIPEIGRGFALCEAQIGSANLGQLPAGAQAGEGQRRVGAGGDDQVHTLLQRWEMIEQKRNDPVDCGCFDRVIVVQNQDRGL
ncbi:MAG: hypothetical protein P8129_12000 [Anaerolineae bacterium]